MKLSKNFILLFIACVMSMALASVGAAEEDAVSVDDEITIAPQFIAMFGDGPGIRHLEHMWYYPGSCRNYEVGMSTNISLYEAYSDETWKKYFIMVFVDKSAAQDFISSGETITELKKVGESYCDERDLNHFDKILTGLNAYMGTNDRPGIAGMQIDNIKGFAIAFRADPIETEPSETTE